MTAFAAEVVTLDAIAINFSLSSANGLGSVVTVWPQNGWQGASTLSAIGNGGICWRSMDLMFRRYSKLHIRLARRWRVWLTDEGGLPAYGESGSTADTISLHQCIDAVDGNRHQGAKRRWWQGHANDNARERHAPPRLAFIFVSGVLCPVARWIPFPRLRPELIIRQVD